MSKKKQIAIYARVSTDKQKVELQLRELRDFAERRGLQVCQEYIDEGYSGADTKRPAFGKKLGRPKISGAIIEQVKKLKDGGMSNRAIARKLKIDEGTVRKRISGKIKHWGKIL